MARAKKRSEFYASDRRKLVTRCREIRDALTHERSGSAIHHLEIDLRFTRDQLAYLRRSA